MAATEVVIRRSLVRAQVEEPGFSVERQALRSMAWALFFLGGWSVSIRYQESLSLA